MRERERKINGNGAREIKANGNGGEREKDNWEWGRKGKVQGAASAEVGEKEKGDFFLRATQKGKPDVFSPHCAVGKITTNRQQGQQAKP
jgi:hypothetical protein